MLPILRIEIILRESTFKTDLLNVQNFTPTGFFRWTKFTPKKCVNFVKILNATKYT